MTTLRRVLQQSADLAPPTPALEEPPAAVATVVAEDAVAATALAAVTWVQCDTCQKWRKLPPNMEDALGEVWTCNMNKWAPNGGSCDDPEDAEDPIAVLPVSFDVAPQVIPEPAVAPSLPPAPLPPVREKKPSAPPPPAVIHHLPLAPLLPPGINLYGQAFQIPPLGKQARIVSYRDLIASHYRNNKTFNPHYDHICDTRYAAFSCYTSPTVHLEPAFPQSQPPVLFPPEASRLPPKKRHKHSSV
ncbi:hypothetical protein BASA81_006160 [Batrachochytrium salamandrivorans]|nr:hypothetical protein BASA81_006160 [Batrachochytrium salamandrivorans]